MGIMGIMGIIPAPGHTPLFLKFCMFYVAVFIVENNTSVCYTVTPV